MRETLIKKAIFHYGTNVKADFEKYLTNLNLMALKVLNQQLRKRSSSYQLLEPSHLSQTSSDRIGDEDQLMLIG